MKLNKFKTAKRALKTYFGSERSKNRNQFYVRALFATACIESNRSPIFEIEKKIEGLNRRISVRTQGCADHLKNSLIDSTRFPASTCAVFGTWCSTSILSFIYSYHIHSLITMRLEYYEILNSRFALELRY